MADSLQHRGPDDHGFLTWSGAGEAEVAKSPAAAECRLGLVHLRLSILDLSDAGWQPMRSRDGRFHMVYNGEIYNFVELREELRSLGHSFRSTGDSEVLLTAFSEWGEKAFDRLVGMYSVAVFDSTARELTLARDPFGIKPMFYAASNSMFAFASEIKALLPLPHVGRRASASALHDYLRFGLLPSGTDTFFADVRQLPGGCVAVVDVDRPDRVDVRRFATLPTERDYPLSFGDAADNLRELFIDSIRLHLRSDVPVGVALSGGIDSSAVIAAVRAVGGAGVDLRAFSYVADDPRLTEAAWIDVAAKATNAHVTKVSPEPPELARDLDRLIAAQDEPFASTSIYAQYRVFALAAESGVKVMLDGQGADEMLAGYPPYISSRIATMLGSGRALGGVQLARKAAARAGGSALAVYGKAAVSLLPPQAYDALRRRLGSDSGADRWINSEWFAARDVSARPRRPQPSLSGALREDFVEIGLPGLLRYEDRNSMAFSIESRVPFLTPALADFVFRLPESYLVSDDGTSKSVFRAAMRGLVPDAILDRKDKIGFATPEKAWIEALRPWAADVISDADPAALPCLRLGAVRAELATALDGGSDFGWHVWRWINVIRWSQLYNVDIAGAAD